jgi:hypothetical protein
MLDRTFIALLIIVSVATGFLLGLSVAGTYAWVSPWLRDWQTLIAGIIAVFAAILTVTQMRIEAQSDEERYRGTIAASRARERRLLEGALKHAESLLPIVAACAEIKPLQPTDLNADSILKRGARCRAIGMLLKTSADAWILEVARPYMDYEAVSAIRYMAITGQALEENGRLLADSATNHPVLDKTAEFDQQLVKSLEVAINTCHRLRQSLTATLETYAP